MEQLHELWAKNAALLFDTRHGAADDGLNDYRPFDVDLTSLCEPAEMESTALTWTLRLRVADQCWRYVHDVERTFEVRC